MALLGRQEGQSSEWDTGIQAAEQQRDAAGKTTFRPLAGIIYSTQGGRGERLCGGSWAGGFEGKEWYRGSVLERDEPPQLL